MSKFQYAAKRTVACEFKKVKDDASGLTIEGYSNAATVDRMKERIDPKGWDLENYKKNPIVLFDHGLDMAFGNLPIGKAVVVEPQDEGLYTKIQVSKSSTEKIKAVRDLIEEGILKTFSVGFDPKTDTKDGDTLVITKAELVEQSVVPVPMNQDSTFTLLAKKRKLCPVASKWLSFFSRKALLAKKNAWASIAILQRIHDLELKGQANEKEVVAAVAKHARVKKDAVEAVIAGASAKIPAAIARAFGEVLGVSAELLKSVSDVDGYDAVRLVSVKADQPDDKEDGEEVKAAGDMTLALVKIPKAAYEDQELAAQAAETMGYAIDQLAEEADHWVFVQADMATLDMSKAEAKEVENGVIEIIAPIKAETDAETESETEEETESESDEETAPDLVKLREAYTAEVAAVEGDGEGNPPAWVADEGAWAKAKEMARAIDSEEGLAGGIYGMTVWLYLNTLGGGKKGGAAEAHKSAIPSGASAVGQDDNPYLHEARQTNVLLGTLIREVQGMSTKLNGVADYTLDRQAESEKDRTTETVDTSAGDKAAEDEAKKRHATFVADLDMRLKRLGV